MRIDHYAYQRATKVAGIGLLIQVLIGTVLLVFGLSSPQEAGLETRGDTALTFAALYVLGGTLVWLGLVAIFHQHKLERLEALEEDELAAARAGTSSIFDAATDELRVAARRLRLMHKWLMPTISLSLAGLVGGLAWWMWGRVQTVAADLETFHLTDQLGWAVAICLAFATISFIFSRFVAGMATLTAWQNLRGGAAYMVGNAVVILAVAVGIGFRFFKNDEVIRGIATAIPIFMIFPVTVEIVLNFILNLYRPRIPGQTPRPAFDSKVLSYLAAPDSIVRSINEAVNYQFGFDVTSSWGYQLLLRSFFWLLAFGAGVLVLLNTMVVVEPHQQAVRLRGGEVVGDVHGSGIMWKLPWPLETAAVYDVGRVRRLVLTARRQRPAAAGRPGFVEVHLWSNEMKTDADLDPFIVRGSTVSIDDAGAGASLGRVDLASLAELEPAIAPPLEVEAAEAAGDLYSLIDAEIVLEYRIKDEGPAGLPAYLRFAPDTRLPHRAGLTMRKAALKALALREITHHLSQLTLDEVLVHQRADLARELRARVQAAFDDQAAGVELVTVLLPTVRPSGSAAAAFEELAISVQARQQRIAQTERLVVGSLTYWLGDPDLAEPVAEAMIDFERAQAEHDRVSGELGPDAPKSRALAADLKQKRDKVERLLRAGGGRAAQRLADSEKKRWIDLMLARGEASRVQGQLPAYLAAPRLFRERENMRRLADGLTGLRNKYLIAIDPERVDINFEMPNLTSPLDLSDVIKQGETGP